MQSTYCVPQSKRRKLYEADGWISGSSVGPDLDQGVWMVGPQKLWLSPPGCSACVPCALDDSCHASASPSPKSEPLGPAFSLHSAWFFGLGCATRWGCGCAYRDSARLAMNLLDAYCAGCNSQICYQAGCQLKNKCPYGVVKYIKRKKWFTDI